MVFFCVLISNVFVWWHNEVASWQNGRSFFCFFVNFKSCHQLANVNFHSVKFEFSVEKIKFSPLSSLLKKVIGSYTLDYLVWYSCGWPVTKLGNFKMNELRTKEEVK